MKSTYKKLDPLLGVSCAFGLRSQDLQDSSFDWRDCRSLLWCRTEVVQELNPSMTVAAAASSPAVQATWRLPPGPDQLQCSYTNGNKRS